MRMNGSSPFGGRNFNVQGNGGPKPQERLQPIRAMARVAVVAVVAAVARQKALRINFKAEASSMAKKMWFHPPLEQQVRLQTP